MKVKLKGNLDKVIGKLDKLSENSRILAAHTTLRYGEESKEELDKQIVRQNIIDTGRLRRSVDADYIGKNRVVVTSEAIDPRNRVDYAPFQEYGTRHITPRPYFYVTLRRVAKTLDKYVRKLSKKLLR